MKYLDEMFKQLEDIEDEYDDLFEQWEKINQIYDEINRITEEEAVPISYFKPVLRRLDEKAKELESKENLLKKKTKRFDAMNKIKSKIEKISKNN